MEKLRQFVLQEEMKQIVIITDAPQPVMGVRGTRQWIRPAEELKGKNFGGKVVGWFVCFKLNSSHMSVSK